MNKQSHKLLRLMAATIAAVGMLATATSQAFLIDSTTNINDTFTINYLLADAATDPNGNTNNTGQDLTASVVFKLLGFNTGTDKILLELLVTNTTAINDDEVGLQKLAFGTSPDATGVVFTDASDGEFIEADLDVSNEVQNAVTLTLDVESRTGVGAGNRLLAGEFDAFQLDVMFADLTNSGVTFDPFSSKWQTDPDSFEFPGNPPGGGGPPQDIPEPAMVALFGMGLMGMGLSRIRRKRKFS